MNMSPMIQQHRMRRLNQVRPQTDLVPHRPRHNPQGGLFAGYLDQPVLELVDRGIAVFVVHIILNGGVDDCLELNSS